MSAYLRPVRQLYRRPRFLAQAVVLVVSSLLLGASMAQPWPMGAPWSQENSQRLLAFDRYVVYRTQTSSPDYQRVLVVPKAGLPATLPPLAWLLLPGSLFLGGLAGGAVLWVVRRGRSLPVALRRAVRRGELQVLYQPIFALHPRRCVGAEALVRWRRPDGTLTSPELFIPVAEDTGQIQAITDFVLGRVLEQLAPLLRANPRLYVSVNLAANDVSVPRIGALAARLLASYRLTPAQIAFEVTERSLVDTELARDTLQALRTAGHRVLIDDFGTGYCSLSYLQSLPVDGLKIDKAFVGPLNGEDGSGAIAAHIIRLAHDLQLWVIAEGIEAEAQAQWLRAEGVRYGQGWLFAPPLTALQFAELITGGRRLNARRLDDEA